MNEELNTTFLLMGVGMITVFFVLLCVVLIGRALIRFVNRFVPVTENNLSQHGKSMGIALSKLAAITSAVEIFTKGKGQVTGVKKIN